MEDSPEIQKYQGFVAVNRCFSERGNQGNDRNLRVVGSSPLLLGFTEYYNQKDRQLYFLNLPKLLIQLSQKLNE